MKNFSTKTLLFTLSILIVVLIVGHYVVFSFIQNDNNTASTLTAETNSLNAQTSEFSKYSTEDLKILAASITDRIVSNTDFVSFIENIETAARIRNVSITVRSVNNEKRSDDAADDKEIMRLQLETTGSWQNTMKYINYLEYLPYKITITDLGFSVLTEEGKPSKIPAWRGKIEITVLKFK